MLAFVDIFLKKIGSRRAFSVEGSNTVRSMFLQDSSCGKVGDELQEGKNEDRYIRKRLSMGDLMAWNYGVFSGDGLKEPIVGNCHGHDGNTFQCSAIL